MTAAQTGVIVVVAPPVQISPPQSTMVVPSFGGSPVFHWAFPAFPLSAFPLFSPPLSAFSISASTFLATPDPIILLPHPSSGTGSQYPRMLEKYQSPFLMTPFFTISVPGGGVPIAFPPSAFSISTVFIWFLSFVVIRPSPPTSTTPATPCP